MIDRYLVPDVVRNLRIPFCFTSRAARKGGIALVPTKELIDALDRVLAGLEEVRVVISDNSPSDLFFWPDMAAETLCESMPTLSSITLIAVADRLREIEPGGSPSLERIEQTGRRWVRLILESSRKLALQAISDRADDGRLEPYASELLVVVERRIAGLEPVWGQELLSSLAADVGAPAIPLIEHIAATDSLDPLVRQHAEHKLYAFARKLGRRIR